MGTFLSLLFMITVEKLMKRSSEIEQRLCYTFKDKSLLTLAFIHRSFINENKEVREHNERLEFLGDSILGLLSAEYLYRHLPETPEGELSYLRSRLVEASSCVSYVHQLGLEPYIALGKGERHNNGRGRESILADLFEAIIGAVYLDGGLEEARKFFLENFHEKIAGILETPQKNWKAIFQDYCQKSCQQTPSYEIISESGPDHRKTFRMAVLVQNKEMGYGEGASKKEAAQEAAYDALKNLDKLPSDE